MKKLENKLLSRYGDIKQIYRPINLATESIVDKNKY